MEVKYSNLYDNIAIFSPANILLCYVNKKKISFYIKKNLVDKIDDQNYRLTFTPKGLGTINEGQFAQTPSKRINQCVVSGTTINLTLHHVVPTYVRRHFPLEEKSNFQF